MLLLHDRAPGQGTASSAASASCSAISRSGACLGSFKTSDHDRFGSLRRPRNQGQDASAAFMISAGVRAHISARPPRESAAPWPYRSAVGRSPDCQAHGHRERHARPAPSLHDANARPADRSAPRRCRKHPQSWPPRRGQRDADGSRQGGARRSSNSGASKKPGARARTGPQPDKIIRGPADLTPRRTRYVPNFGRATARPRGYDRRQRWPLLTPVAIVRTVRGVPAPRAVRFTLQQSNAAFKPLLWPSQYPMLEKNQAEDGPACMPHQSRSGCCLTS